MLGWPTRAREVVRRVDQRDMRERLREIADLPGGARVVSLRQQSDIIAQVEKVMSVTSYRAAPPRVRKLNHLNHSKCPNRPSQARLAD